MTPRAIAQRFNADGVVHTQSTISVGRHEVASTAAVFRITGGVPPVLTFAGPLTVYPQLVDGTLTAALVGTLDLSTAPTEANFSATASSVTGDGQLSRVTGQLEIKGVQNLATGVHRDADRPALRAARSASGLEAGFRRTMSFATSDVA
jgi:hypothetical protein